MKAKLIKQVRNGRNMGLEVTSFKTATVIYKGEIKAPVRVICYSGRSKFASVCHVSIFVDGKVGENRIYHSGYGRAGGSGYHKESSALADAIENAGIELDKSIDGRGTMGMEEAMEAIVRAMGYRGKVRIVGF